MVLYQVNNLDKQQTSVSYVEFFEKTKASSSLILEQNAARRRFRSGLKVAVIATEGGGGEEAVFRLFSCPDHP